jgi:hypothetical protein
MGRAPRVVASFAGVLALTAVARATVLVPADLAELARSAAAVAYGRVVDVRARVASDTRRIERQVTVAVIEYYKGDLGRTVTLSIPGGRVGYYRTVMPGAPEFTEGEEVVVFLGTGAAASPYLLGLGQGVFRVVPDDRTGERFVVSPVVLRDPSSRGAVVVTRGDPSRVPLRLPDFAAEVQRAIAPARERRTGRER